MNEKYQLLYNEMLQDIIRNQEQTLQEGERVASGFWIAHKYWERLKKIIDPDNFTNENEEIEFFRNVKPQFTAHIEYYTILSEALVCLPSLADEAIDFWKEEAKRFNRFCEKNEEFVNYYESGQHFKDGLFFVKRNDERRYIPKAPVYDVGSEYSTSHDHLVRGYLAYKMYNEYAQDRINELKKN